MSLKRCAHLLERAVYPTSRLLNIVAIGILIAMMLLTVTDVTLRYVFNRPVTASYEGTELMMATLVFLGIAYCAVNKGHVNIELVVHRFSQRAQAIIDSITGFLGIGLFAVISWQSILRASYLWRLGEKGGMTGLPLFPFLYIVAFGSAMLCLVLLTQLISNLSKVKGK